MLTPNNLDQAGIGENLSVPAAWERPAGHSAARKFGMTLTKFVARSNPIFWMLFDVIAALLAICYSFELSPKAVGFAPSWTQIIIFPLMIVLGGLAAGLYERSMLRRRTQVFFALLGVTVFAETAMAVAAMLVNYEKTGRLIMLFSGLVYFCCALAPRLAAFYLVQLYQIRILIVGGENISCSVSQRLNDEKYHFELIGSCSETYPARDAKVLGGIADIPRICFERRVDEVVISSEYLNHPEVLRQCFAATRCGCMLLDQSSFYEDYFEQIPVDHIDESWFFRSRINTTYRFQILLKRGLDIVLAVIGLALLALIFPLVWLLIRLTSAGPVFYSQLRCGQFEMPFRIWKFRTMRVDAETAGAKWAQAGDSRITLAGRLLRRTRIDEMPQFWNVLKGEMSFVGPRPERPEMAAEIEKQVTFFFLRHWARPGLTGLAQIRHRYGASVEDAKEKLQHDLYYIKNWSLTLDIRILLRTLTAVMRGAR